MNIGIFAKPNTKGQIVIPKKYRDALGMHEDILLHLVIQGRGVYITSAEESVYSGDSRMLLVDVLKKTAGSWMRDDWEETEEKRRKIELKASKNRKKLWS